MMRLFFIVLSILLGQAVLPAQENSPARPWAALVYLAPGTDAPDPRIASLAKELARLFGYAHAEVLGAAWATEGSSSEESWSIPSREFFAKLTHMDATRNLYRVELFRRNKRLFEARAILPEGTPLFIAGPAYEKGRLAFVIERRQP